MTPETPLPQVALFLGQRTAVLLDREPTEVQMLVLIALRSYVVLLESQQVLDPITLEKKLHQFVDCFLMAYKGERRA